MVNIHVVVQFSLDSRMTTVLDLLVVMVVASVVVLSVWTEVDKLHCTLRL